MGYSNENRRELHHKSLSFNQPLHLRLLLVLLNYLLVFEVLLSASVIAVAVHRLYLFMWARNLVAFHKRHLT